MAIKFDYVEKMALEPTRHIKDTDYYAKVRLRKAVKEMLENSILHKGAGLVIEGLDTRIVSSIVQSAKREVDQAVHTTVRSTESGTVNFRIEPGPIVK